MCNLAEQIIEEKRNEFGEELMSMVLREIKLRTIDQFWKDHLLNMDHLKEGVSWEGYAQKDPLVMYQIKGFEMFSQMADSMKETSLERVFHVQLAPQNQVNSEELFQQRRKLNTQRLHGQANENSAMPNRPKVNQNKTHGTVRRSNEKVGRNDPCPCGSGKKFKKCHGA